MTKAKPADPTAVSRAAPPTASPRRPASEAFLAAIVESSDDAILSKDLKGIITSWNPGAERLFGYKAKEAIGKPGTLLIPPNLKDEEPQILARIARGEKVDHYETVRRRKDGSLVEISLTVSPIRNSAGKIVGASKIARDITAEKEEQVRFRVTLESIGDGVIATDVNGDVTFINPVAEALTGWHAKDAIGSHLTSVFKIVKEGTQVPMIDPVSEVVRIGTKIGLANHTVLINRDGTARPIADSAAPIRLKSGKLLGVVLVFRDVSEQRAAEILDQRLRAIIDGSDDAIIAKTLQGIVTHWNPGAERLFGFTEGEMIGQPITRIFPVNRLYEEQQILARMLRGEKVDHFETERVRKGGTKIQVSVTISPIRDGDGRIVGVSKIAREIDSRRASQDEESIRSG